MSSISVRFALPGEVNLIYKLIHQKAEFDRSIGAYKGTIQTNRQKIEQTIFSDHPFARVLFAEAGGEVMGFALYGFRYSSFVGQPSIWLDDLYVETSQRSQGAGSLLMSYLRDIAQKTNCTHIAWTADARNLRGLQFYDRIGAKIVNQQKYRCFFRWNL